MQPNPYETPKANERPSSSQLAKRGIGVVTIALLTPLAVAITGFISCNAGVGLVNSRMIDSTAKAMLCLAAGLAISWVPPIAVLVWMIRWAVATHRRKAAPPPADKLDDSPKKKNQDSTCESASAAGTSDMTSKRQFSLRHLLTEIFLIGLTLGLFRAAVEVSNGYGVALVLAGAVTTGAAIGGMSGHMATGAFIAFGLALVGCLLMPAVMTA